MKGVLLGWVVGFVVPPITSDFCSASPALVGPAQKLFFLAVHWAGQSCRVAYLLVFVSVADFSNNAITSVIALIMIMAVTAGDSSTTKNKWTMSNGDCGEICSIVESWE